MITPAQRKAIHAAIDTALNTGANMHLSVHPNFTDDGDLVKLNLLRQFAPTGPIVVKDSGWVNFNSDGRGFKATVFDATVPTIRPQGALQGTTVNGNPGRFA